MREDPPRGTEPLGSVLTHLLRWVPPVLWMGVIFVLSSDLGSEAHSGQFILPILERLFPSLSPETYALLHDIFRKLGHLAEYGVLSVLWARALAAERRRWEVRHIAGAVGICVLWAIVDEVHQSFVLSRAGNATDVAIDAVGALLAQGLRRLFRPPLP